MPRIYNKKQRQTIFSAISKFYPIISQFTHPLQLPFPDIISTSLTPEFAPILAVLSPPLRAITVLLVLRQWLIPYCSFPWHALFRNPEIRSKTSLENRGRYTDFQFYTEILQGSICLVKSFQKNTKPFYLMCAGLIDNSRIDLQLRVQPDKVGRFHWKNTGEEDVKAWQKKLLHVQNAAISYNTPCASNRCTSASLRPTWLGDLWLKAEEYVSMAFVFQGLGIKVSRPVFLQETLPQVNTGSQRFMRSTVQQPLSAGQLLLHDSTCSHLWIYRYFSFT